MPDWFSWRFFRTQRFARFFEIADRVENSSPVPWELHIAGEAQDEAGRQLVSELRARYESKPWWLRVHWHGWVGQPQVFLSQLDLLIVPSSEFDPLPTVLLEAGQMGVPVLAARVGGVAEVIKDGDTGWLFDASDWPAAATLANRFLSSNQASLTVGRRALENIRSNFSVTGMVKNYCHLYSALFTDSRGTAGQ